MYIYNIYIYNLLQCNALYVTYYITHNNNNTCNFMIDIYTIYIYCNSKPTMQLLSILAELPSNTRCLQVEDETWTVLAIGPDASKKIDMVTGTPVSGMAHCFRHGARCFLFLLLKIPARGGDITAICRPLDFPKKVKLKRLDMAFCWSLSTWKDGYFPRFGSGSIFSKAI